MIKWLKSLFTPDDIGGWMAQEYLKAVLDGDYYVFSEETRIHLEDWNPIREPVQFLMIHSKAHSEGFELETNCPETYLRALRQWLLEK